MELNLFSFQPTKSQLTKINPGVKLLLVLISIILLFYIDLIGENGLTDKVLKENEKKFGKNLIKEKRQKSIIKVFFDQFKEYSDSILKSSAYSKKAPMLNILDYFEQIHNNNSLQHCLELDLFFTVCLQKKIIHELNNTELNENDLSRMSKYIDDFVNQMTINPNLKTKQDIIIEELKNKINLKNFCFIY